MNVTFPEIPILFEDDDVLVINKPAGIVVNRAQTQSEPTIQDWLEEQQQSHQWKNYDLSLQGISHEFGTPEEIFAQRSGIGHRLDKDTSGILVCAKHPSALVLLMQQFKNRQVKKIYTALVHGKMSPEVGEINAPIGRHHLQRLKFAVREDGRASVTEYATTQFYSGVQEDKWLEVIRKRFQERKSTAESTDRQLKKVGLTGNFRRSLKIYQGFSLLELVPHTGRTHQIRVHCAHLNHPLVGDHVYTGKKRQALDVLWCPRHFLHASGIKFTHPRTGLLITIEAPLPADLQQVLELLQTA